MFTGSLIAFGVCLIALRGRTPIEYTFLNLPGIFAFLVALVPTGPPDPENFAQGRECWSVPVDYANTYFSGAEWTPDVRRGRVPSLRSNRVS